MIELLNDILITYTLPGLILCFGLCFFFIVVPNRMGLQGYGMARRMMAWAYLVFSAAQMADAMGMQNSMSELMQQMLMITIGLMQAFLFTYALTTLIDVQFFTWRRFMREAFIIGMPIMVALLVPWSQPHIPFILLSLFYFYKLIDYVLRFRRHYRNYEQRMANYFSDDERKRLQWVWRSFFTALSIGVLALLYALFPSKFTSLMFTLVVTVYYAIFGIRFINYAFTFQEIEAPLLTPQEEESGTDGSQALEEQEALMARIDALMTDRRLYTKPDLTIEDVAVQAGTSYRFISSAINACRHTNFKGWVNGYRVAEAQRLIHEGYLGSHTIEALAAAVGFSSRTNLYRVFKKLTSQSPTDFCPPATKF